MSLFSGKCDVYDFFGDETDEFLQNSNFYIGDNLVPLRINNQHDLAPYYSHLVSSCGSDKNHTVCYLSNCSFIDTEEEDLITWKLNKLKAYRRKCKRKKIPYNVDEAIANCSFVFKTDVCVQELACRVGESGDKATIDGVHDYMHEYYRKALFDEMIKLGWPENQAGYWIWKDEYYNNKKRKEQDMDGKD